MRQTGPATWQPRHRRPRIVAAWIGLVALWFGLGAIAPTGGAAASQSALPVAANGADGSPRAASNPLKPVPILMYHYVGATPAGADRIRRNLTVSLEAFEAQLDWLASRGYQPVTINQAVAAWRGDDDLPERPIVMTFDDGYAETITLVGPRLAARGWTAEFYVITGLVGQPGYADWAALQELATLGMSIQSHTVSHRDLTRLSPTALDAELIEARQTLEAQFGVTIEGFCYPAGRWNDRVRSRAVQAGYRAATTTKWGIANARSDPMALPRLRVWGGETLAQFAAALNY